MREGRRPVAKRQILVIDSGVGGLGIVGAIRKAAPEAAIAFVADHGFFPYGEKTDLELVERLASLLGRLSEAVRPEIVVLACNTASTIALAPLRARLPTPFVGCVPPVKWASAVSRTRVIGLLATGATVGRTYVHDLRMRFAPDCRLIAHGARGLAGLAERHFVGEPLSPGAVAAEIAPLFAAEDGHLIDTVCLGCTHYGLLLAALRDASPRPLAWLDPADAVARRVAALLAAPVPEEDRAPLDVAWTTRWPPARDRFVRGCLRFGFEEVCEISGATARVRQKPRLTV